RNRRMPVPDRQTTVLVAGLGALAGAAAFVWYEQATRNPRPRRRPDSAPGRTARQARFGRYAVTGRTVTINKPKAELYAFWRDFANLPRFMTHVKAVETEGDLTRWTIAGPLGRDVRIETRIVDDREGEQSCSATHLAGAARKWRPSSPTCPPPARSAAGSPRSCRRNPRFRRGANSSGSRC
ncbi:MAG: hypothetical protein MUF63_13815, partial [Rhodobacteraceae bacterium]|nr:hypothetical protein [Paracoccaceae bacterium]